MASEFISDVIDVPQLIGYTREATANGRPFDPWLPPLRVDDIEYSLQNFNGRDGMQVAKYRSWDAAPSLGRRPGLATITGEIPPLGRSVKLNEKDVLRLDKLRAGVGDTGPGSVLDVIFNDAANMAQAVNNRLTWAVSDLLQDGALTIEDDVSGQSVTATFSVPGAQLGVTPAIAFSTVATAVPITEIAAWQAIFRTNNGGANPDFWITSSAVMADLTLNAQIRNLVQAGSSGGAQGIINPTTVQQVLQSHAIAPVVVVDLELPQVFSDTFARVIPVRKFIGVKVATLGNTLFAPSPNAMLMAGNGELQFSDAAGVIAFVERSIRPASVLTTGEAVALPVLRDPNALFVATV